MYPPLQSTRQETKPETLELWKEYLSISAHVLGHTRSPGAPVHFVLKEGAVSFQGGT